MKLRQLAGKSSFDLPKLAKDTATDESSTKN